MAPFTDELTPIAVYMTNEMNQNPKGEIARQIRALWKSDETCIEYFESAPWWRNVLGVKPADCKLYGLNPKFIALLLWANNVRPGAVWDHKPKIKSNPQFYSFATGTTEWHVWGSTAYNHDCWSNIHYGYVGTAIGFPPDVLLDGAGVAQLISDVLKYKTWPKGHGPWLLPRHWDAPEDRIAISAGIKLYRRQPVGMTMELLRFTVIDTRGLLTKEASMVDPDIVTPAAAGLP